MSRDLSILLTTFIAAVAVNLTLDALEALAGQKVRDLDGRLIPAHLTDAELVALLGGRR